MPDGIRSGVAEQLGQLGKQIVAEVVQAPAKIAGINETAGQGTGGKQQGQKNLHAQANSQKSPEQIAREDEIEKQKQLVQARRMLQQFIQPTGQEPSLREKMEQEEMEKRKKEIEEERKNAANQIAMPSSKPKRGNLYGVKTKTHGAELGKNVKSG